MTKHRCFAIVGWKNSGKTTLVAKLVGHFANQGLLVSTLKHAHHSFDLDQNGTDSFKHRSAGAKEVALVSGKRWAIQHELNNEPEPTVEEMLERLSPCDLVLVEGFKGANLPKLEIVSSQSAPDYLWPKDNHVKAVIGDKAITQCALPQFTRDDITGIADFILNTVKSNDT